ncbi:hypothetical protein Tco_0710149 [Tanacetum coccineum]
MKMCNDVLEATTINGNKEVTKLFLELKGDDRGACKLLEWLLGNTAEQITTAGDTLNTDSINVSTAGPSNGSVVGPSTSTTGIFLKMR